MALIDEDLPVTVADSSPLTVQFLQWQTFLANLPEVGGSSQEHAHNWNLLVEGDLGSSSTMKLDVAKKVQNFAQLKKFYLFWNILLCSFERH